MSVSDIAPQLPKVPTPESEPMTTNPTEGEKTTSPEGGNTFGSPQAAWANAAQEIWDFTATAPNIVALQGDAAQGGNKTEGVKPAEGATEAELADAAKRANTAIGDKPAQPTDKGVGDAGNAAAPERSVQWLEKSVELSDKTDTKKALDAVLEGQVQSLNLIEAIAQPGLSADRQKVLTDLNKNVDAAKWNDYLRYLDPALTRAELAFAKISTGDDKAIAEGERSLIEAVSMRHELQMDQVFQDKLLAAYRQMETTRQKNGQPAWNGELKFDAGTASSATANPAETMGKANEVYGNKGTKEALKLFEQAIAESDALPKDQIGKELTDLFCKRLTVDRKIVAGEVRGQNVEALKNEQQTAQDNEFAKYQEYLMPGSARANAAFALISSGDPTLLATAKKFLGEAITNRPELEFNSDYQAGLRQAFKNHFEKKAAEQPAAQPGTTDGDKEKNKPFNVGYEPTKTGDQTNGKPGKPMNLDDKELQPYFADAITGPLLTAGVIYLAARKPINRAIRWVYNKATSGGTAATEADPKAGETKPGESKPGDQKPVDQKPGDQKPGDQKPADQKPGDQKPADQKPAEQKPAEVKPADSKPVGPEVKPEVKPGGTTTGGNVDELKIETSPFQSSTGQGDTNINRPTAAMEAGKIVEIALPGGIVARIAKAEAPAYMDKLEREFKSDDLGKFFDDMANDKNRTDKEREQFRDMKTRYDKLDPAGKLEAKAEFFANMRAELGIETESKVETTRGARVARALGIGGAVLGVGLVSAALLRYCLGRAQNNHLDRVNVEFIKK